MALQIPLSACVDDAHNCIVNENNIAVVVDATYTGLYRFLKDHFINNTIIPRGTIQAMIDWLPTPDVDPLDTTAVQYFYFMGPILGTRVESSFNSVAPVAPPVTYWQQVSPRVWGLTGLGSNRTNYPLIESFQLGRA